MELDLCIKVTGSRKRGLMVWGNMVAANGGALSTMSKPQLRQLDWWEVLQPGDWQVIAGDNIFRRTKYCLGWNVDRAFGFYRTVGETVLFYRKVETK